MAPNGYPYTWAKIADPHLSRSIELVGRDFLLGKTRKPELICDLRALIATSVRGFLTAVSASVISPFAGLHIRLVTRHFDHVDTNVD